MTRLLAKALLWRDVRLERSFRVPGALDALTMLALLAIYFYIARSTHAHAVGLALFTYIVPGLALLRYQFGLVRTVGHIDQEQTTGTLELLLSTPARASGIAAAASLYELVRATVGAVLVLILGRFVFGAELTLGPAAWPGLLLGLLGTAAFFLGLTLATCAVVVAFKMAPALLAVLSAGVPILSGIYFAPSVLPAGINLLARFFPLTRAGDIIRSAVIAGDFPVLKAVVMLVATGLCVPLGAFAFERANRYARRRGLLGQY